MEGKYLQQHKKYIFAFRSSKYLAIDCEMDQVKLDISEIQEFKENSEK